MRRSRKWFLRRGAHRVASRNAKRSRQTRGEIWTLWVRVHLDLLGGEKRTLSLKGLVLRTDWAVRGVGGSALTWSASTRATRRRQRTGTPPGRRDPPRAFAFVVSVYVEERDSIIYFIHARGAGRRPRARADFSSRLAILFSIGCGSSDPAPRGDRTRDRGRGPGAGGGAGPGGGAGSRAPRSGSRHADGIRIRSAGTCSSGQHLPRAIHPMRGPPKRRARRILHESDVSSVLHPTLCLGPPSSLLHLSL